jgi:hypothetical protein
VDNLVISLTAKGLSFFMPVYPGAPKEASTQPSSSL